MKKFIIATMFATMSFAASAQTVEGPTTPLTGGEQRGVTNSQSLGQADASNAGNAQNITFNTAPPPASTYNETKLENVPAIGAPALTTSNDTCMGSTSGGVAVAGFGLQLGSTWSDKNCLMLKNSREMWNMGFKAAALARMCMDELNKEALELTGFVCPTKKAE